MAQKRDEMTTAKELEIQFKKIREQLNSKGLLPIKIISGSMEPVIKVNDKVVIKKIDQPLKRFDIIVYKSERELVCHLVKHINQFMTEGENNLIQTRGLNSHHDDIPVHLDDVLGLVVSHKINVWRKLLLLWAIR